MQEVSMNRFNKFLVAAFMSAAMLLPNMAQAMDIIQFDLMTAQNQQDFLNSLSKAAETVLEQEGRSADALKVFHLFNDIRPGDNLPVGEAELEPESGQRACPRCEETHPESRCAAGAG